MSYGFMPNNGNKLLLIKTGTDGSIYGYNNKYLQISTCFSNCGYSILCCGSPSELNDMTSFQLAITIAKELLGNQFQNIQISYLGISRGAYQGILYGDNVAEISELLLINSPLPFNFHKQTLSLKKAAKPHYVVFGTADPSYKFFHFLEQIDNAQLNLLAIPNADHHFSNHSDIFLDLPRKILIAHEV